MVQRLDRLKESASQTAGPYVHIGLTPNFCGIDGVYPADLGATMVNADTRGERISVRMRVFDGADAPLKDALIEIWQADADGLYNSPSEMRGGSDPNFTGWGRKATDMTTGECIFETIKPGRVPFPDGRLMAPHITVWIVARGINIGLHTRMYFPEETSANDQDPVLQRIEHKSRISTLIARREGASYAFDVRLQGDDETIFFDI
jgi:protocatechuate 3,4-dioxygenase alpha subunit